jgi:hypothetical protein
MVVAHTALIWLPAESSWSRYAFTVSRWQPGMAAEFIAAADVDSLVPGRGVGSGPYWRRVSITRWAAGLPMRW